MAANNNANNVISNNDFANAGDIRFLECALTTSYKEFTFEDTPFQIQIDNTPATDIDGAETGDIDVKFASAETTNIKVPFAIPYDLVPFRSASIFMKAVTAAFKVNIRYNVKGTQTIV